MRVQRPADAGERSRYGERQRLVARQVDAHALCGNLRIADGDKRAPCGRAQQVQNGQRAHHRDQQAQKVERLGGLERVAEHLRRHQVLAGVAARHRLPARKHLFHDEAERQRGHAQVDALDAQRGQAHHHAHGGRQPRSAGQRQRKRPSHAREHGLRISPHAQKGRVPEREQPREPGQQHEPQSHDGVDQHKGELGQPILGRHPGRSHQRQAQQAVPEHMAAMFGQAQVLFVAGLEDESHAVTPSCAAFRQTVRWASP
ncbi:hypothetical protein D3C71_1487360 [compost metagenome]